MNVEALRQLRRVVEKSPCGTAYCAAGWAWKDEWFLKNTRINDCFFRDDHVVKACFYTLRKMFDISEKDCDNLSDGGHRLGTKSVVGFGGATHNAPVHHSRIGGRMEKIRDQFRQYLVDRYSSQGWDDQKIDQEMNKFFAQSEGSAKASGEAANLENIGTLDETIKRWENAHGKQNA